MSMPGLDDDMSLREIARTLADFRAEFRNQVAQLVRTDVYRAEQAAVEARINSLAEKVRAGEQDRERDEQDRTSWRRGVQIAIVSAIASPLVSMVLVLITR